MAAAKKVKAPAALILALGKGPAKAGSKPGAMGEDAEDDADESSEVPPDFEEEAIAAFPELDGETERLAALYRAVKCCM